MSHSLDANTWGNLQNDKNTFRLHGGSSLGMKKMAVNP